MRQAVTGLYVHEGHHGVMMLLILLPLPVCSSANCRTRWHLLDGERAGRSEATTGVCLHVQVATLVEWSISTLSLAYQRDASWQQWILEHADWFEAGAIEMVNLLARGRLRRLGLQPEELGYSLADGCRPVHGSG